jgi:hypothetical protein
VADRETLAIAEALLEKYGQGNPPVTRLSLSVFFGLRLITFTA